MTSVLEITGYWLGLCRKPPVVRTMQAGFCFPQEAVCEKFPEGGGGSGGSAMIRRGISAALSAMRTLYQNRQLLWFTLFAGLVLAGNAVGQAAFWYLNRILQPDTMVYYIQDVVLAFATLFGLVFLLAGLLLSISSKKEGPASFFAGLCEAKKFTKSLVLWSLVLALAALLLDRMYVYLTMWFPHELALLYTLGDGFFVDTITQFPFNWTLDWNMLTEIPGYGGRSLLLMVYPFGILETLHFLMIALFLFILTPFVVPHIVIGHKTVKEAVAGSFSLLKKTWAGAAACAIFLGVIVTGIFLAHLLLQAASGIVDPYNTVIFHPPGTWIALALLYNIALGILAGIAATVGGIAAWELYTRAKTGPETGSAGTETDP
jgi:hypothetical protein